MVKLYNDTKLPDELLRSLLTDAQRLTKAKGDIVVRVGRTQRGVHGLAIRCDSIRLRKRRVTTARGCIDIWAVLTSHPAYNMLTAAENFFWAAVHEFAHVADYQADPYRSKLPWARRDRKRGHRWTRMDHKKRPEEVRAENVVWDAQNLLKKQKARWLRIQESIIQLALASEALRATASL